VYPTLKADFLSKSVVQDNSLIYMTFKDFIAQFNTVRTAPVSAPLYLASQDPTAWQVFVGYPVHEDASKFLFNGRWVPGDPKSDSGGCPVYPT
jgi:hypothetical protein